MSNFLKTGIYTQGCIIPVTSNDPSVSAAIDNYSEEFRINIYIGSSYIDTITMDNFRDVHPSILCLDVYDFSNNWLKTNVWGEIRKQYIYNQAKIYGSQCIHIVKDEYSLKNLDKYFNLLKYLNSPN